MKRFNKIFASVLLTAAVALASGCQSTASDKDSTSLAITDYAASKSTQTSSAVSLTTPTSSSSVQSSSTTASSKPLQTSEPHFSFPHDDELPPPTGESVRICSLSEALGSFDTIAGKPVGGTPEEIVKTLMERNVLCFAAVQGKCWTAEGNKGVQPIKSSYIKSVGQMEKLFADTYTEDQAYRLMHPQEAGGYGNVFQLNEEDKLCFDLNHLRRRNGDSFSADTYIAVVETSDDEITFGRYYDSTTSGENEPNIQHFKAVKENGDWRLDTYITDAPAYVQQYDELVKTDRIGAPELMELAKEQVGNIGGRKFWGEWYGFDKHVEWCAIFISWCYAQAGKDEPFFTGCYTGAECFKEREQWGEQDYEDIAPGDCIFFDWDLNGDADHVGLVIGTDGEYVYTVEGNRDDICISNRYSRKDFEWILGYGLMEW